MASSVQGTWPLAPLPDSTIANELKQHCPFSSLLFRHVERNSFIKVWIISRGCCFSAFSSPTLTAPHLRRLTSHELLSAVGTNNATLWAFLPFLKITSHHRERRASLPGPGKRAPPEPRGLFLAAHPHPRRGPRCTTRIVGIFFQGAGRRRRGRWSWAMQILVGFAGFSPGRHKSLPGGFASD